MGLRLQPEASGCCTSVAQLIRKICGNGCWSKAAGGAAVGEIAKALHVTSSYVSKVLGRLRATGERTARPQRCHVPPKLAPLYGAIRRQVAERPDMTLAELRAWLLEAITPRSAMG